MRRRRAAHRPTRGETRLPLILNNIHRYFWYAAVVVALILTYDTVLTFRDADGEWGHMGLGTLIFLVNIVLIWLYTLSCHSCRHVVGGRLRHFSKHPVRYQAVDLGLEAQRPARAVRLAVAVLGGVADLYVYLLVDRRLRPTRGSSDEPMLTATR